jgi:regulator of cell morphogenesis and NO signaling
MAGAERVLRRNPMNPILEELSRQHRDAEHMLAELSAAVTRLRSQGAGGPGVLTDLVHCRSMIQGEVDTHFREEEQALFPILGRRIGTEDGPIAVLMEEHCAFRRLQLEYERALAGLEAGREGDWQERLVGAADAMGSLLPPHIEKEDQVLFPMAEAVLEEGEWDEVRALCHCAPSVP